MGKHDLRVVGFTSGIGSMLLGARQAGFRVVGNVEWRGYYHKRDAEGRNTFLENFPGAFMVKRMADLTDDQRSANSPINNVVVVWDRGHGAGLSTLGYPFNFRRSG